MITYPVTVRVNAEIVVKGIVFVVVRFSERLIWFKRKNGKRIYITAYFSKNGKPFIKGLPRGG